MISVMKSMLTFGVSCAKWVGSAILDFALGPEEDFDYVSRTSPATPPPPHDS